MANIGDSRTSIGFRNAKGGVTAINLTIDHKPDLPLEKVNIHLFMYTSVYAYICIYILMFILYILYFIPVTVLQARIEAKGGRVFAVEYDDGVDGPQRVWLGNMDVPGLAMSRSLADVVAHTAGVSSEPEFFEYDFNPDNREDLMLVMASDGLWEFMSDQEVMDIAYATTEPRYAVDKLISESNERWMKEEQVIDDTTVCVAFLNRFMVAGGTSNKK